MLAKEREEELLIELYRAITSFGKEDLVSKADVGDVLEAYVELVEPLKLNSDQDKSSIQFGFIAGIAAVTNRAIQQQEPQWVTGWSPEDLNDQAGAISPETDKGHFVGGSTGGVALEQGKDPRFVTQSGVHEGQNDE